MALKDNTTKRTLYFYELSFNPFVQFEGVEHAYLKCLQHVNKLVKNKDKTRYFKRTNETLFFGQLDFIPDKKYIKGRLYKVRNNVFPQIINMTNEDISDLDIGNDQGVLESTHFIIDYRKKNIAQLAIEYNHYGARISEFVKYLSYIGQKTQVIRSARSIPIVRDRLESIITRVNRLSRFTVRVHKDNIGRIQEVDEGLGSALYHARNFSESDYVGLNLKYDYQLKPDTPKIRERLFSWVRRFIDKPDDADNFEVFKIEAEDEEKNNGIEPFDLLADREQSTIRVAKKDKSRVIISKEFFPIIINEYERKFL